MDSLLGVIIAIIFAEAFVILFILSMLKGRRIFLVLSVIMLILAILTMVLTKTQLSI